MLKQDKKADYFALSSAQMSDAYTLYALALMKFKGDIQGAIQNLKLQNGICLMTKRNNLITI